MLDCNNSRLMSVGAHGFRRHRELVERLLAFGRRTRLGDPVGGCGAGLGGMAMLPTVPVNTRAPMPGSMMALRSSSMKSPESRSVATVYYLRWRCRRSDRA